MAAQALEFICVDCGEVTGTLDPALSLCDDCTLTCDHCNARLSAQTLIRIKPGVCACEDCAPLYSIDEDPRVRGSRAVGASWSWK